MNKIRKPLAMILIMLMIVALLPATAMAVDGTISAGAHTICLITAATAPSQSAQQRL
jgi:hypothetical protein